MDFELLNGVMVMIVFFSIMGIAYFLISIVYLLKRIYAYNELEDKCFKLEEENAKLKEKNDVLQSLIIKRGVE